MQYSYIFKIFYFCLISTTAFSYGTPKEIMSSSNQEENTPTFLYKILSIENWQKSQNLGTMKLSEDDAAFIHFSKEDQLERITSKYWAHIPKYVICKIEVSKLPGKLCFETNPGGSAKYYHLYNGSIPMDAVTEVQIMESH